MKKKKVKVVETQRLLNPNVVVKFGIETEHLVPLLKEYLIPEEYRNRIDIVLRSKAEFQDAYGKYVFLRRFELFLNEVNDNASDFIFPCKCEVCGKIQNMVLGNMKLKIEGKIYPNWRESLICPECACNNHIRFWIGKIRKEYREGMKVLLYEYGSSLYLYTKHYVRDVVACECDSNKKPLNQKDDLKMYQDPCKLDYPSNYFSLVIVNDLWEKIENVDIALKEAARVVKKDGKLIFTTVFNANSEVSIPGIFGWDILDRLKNFGFRDAYVKADFSIEEGYLGYLPMYFEAVK